MIKKVILLFLFWRVLLFVPIITAQQFIEYRNGYEYTSLNHFLDKPNGLISNFLLSPWANFDGVYYLLIAANGYTVNAGFFPLFPLLLHILSSFLGKITAFDTIQYFTALAFVSFCFLLSLIVLYKLIRLDYKENIAMWSIFFMLFFPTSFFFASIYSEGLFLLLAVSSFYFARKKRWFLASLSAGLLSATRLVGIAIIPTIILEFIRSEKTLLKPKSLFLLLAPLGILGYMWFNFQKWGNPFYFIQAQGSFLNNRSVTQPILVPQTIYRYINILTSVSLSHFEWWIALLEISAFVFSSALLFIAWKKKVRTSYLIFSLICFLIPISSGTFTGLPRYILILFPIFISLSLIRYKIFKLFYAVISVVLLFILLMLFSRGYYIA